MFNSNEGQAKFPPLILFLFLFIIVILINQYIWIVFLTGLFVVGLTLVYAAGFNKSIINHPVIGSILAFFCKDFDPEVNTNIDSECYEDKNVLNSHNLFLHLKKFIIGRDNFLTSFSNTLIAYIDRKSGYISTCSVILVFGQQKSGKTSLMKALGSYFAQSTNLNPVWLNSNVIDSNCGLRLSSNPSQIYFIDDFQNISSENQIFFANAVNDIHCSKPTVFIVMINILDEEISVIKSNKKANIEPYDDLGDTYKCADGFNPLKQNIKKEIILSKFPQNLSKKILNLASSYFLLTAPSVESSLQICKQYIINLTKSHNINIEDFNEDCLSYLLYDSINVTGTRSPGYFLSDIDNQFFDDIVELKNNSITEAKLVINELKDKILYKIIEA